MKKAGDKCQDKQYPLRDAIPRSHQRCHRWLAGSSGGGPQGGRWAAKRSPRRPRVGGRGEAKVGECRPLRATARLAGSRPQHRRGMSAVRTATKRGVSIPVMLSSSHSARRTRVKIKKSHRRHKFVLGMFPDASQLCPGEASLGKQTRARGHVGLSSCASAVSSCASDLIPERSRDWAPGL